MKKILFAAAALVAMASCATEDIVSSAAPEAIGFDSAFVDNSTRSNYDPSYTNTNLFPDFAAFAHVNKAVLFNDKVVTGSGINGTWTYEGTQYWVKGAKYNFAAIAPKTVTGDGYWENAVTSVNSDFSAITTEFDFHSNAVTDLLYAEVENIKGEASGNAKIGFSFRHLLSKVKFSFKNEYSTEAFSIKVKDIRIENAYVDGHVKVTNNDTEWTASNATSNLGPIYVGHTNVDGAAYDSEAPAYSYGTTLESHYECFLIPGAVPGGYNVTFTVELWVGDIQIVTYNHSAVVDFAPAPGMAYDINAVLTPNNIDPTTSQEPIEFTVTKIENWDQYTNVDATVMTSVATEAELKAAIAAGENVKLAANIDLTAPIEISQNTIVDLNGKNITADTFLYDGNTVKEDSYAFWVKNGGNLTINGNGVISTADCKYSIAVWAQGGNVTINGGTFQNAGEGSDLIYASANGHVVINGGEFNACEKQNGIAGTEEAYSALNLKGDGTGSSITCYGGRFFKFNPADNKSEKPAVSFVAPGYKSVADGDYFKVVAE